jgi:hypothetical protein
LAEPSTGRRSALARRRDIAKVSYSPIDASVFPMTTVLLGLVGDLGVCAGVGDPCDHETMIVSVTHPDNYDWLVDAGASPVSAIAMFGAGN